MSTVPTEVPEYGGCLWPMDPACLTPEWDALDDEVQVRALALASSTLRRLTGYRVGGCPITVRPVLSRGACFIPFTSPTGVFMPGMNIYGQWINMGFSGEISCDVPLPAPVGTILDVKVDGELLEWEDYSVDNGNMLTWIGAGDCPWPRTQDPRIADTEEGTFSVTYWNAFPVDSLGAYAVGVLAMEFAKACSGSKCRLPSGVTTVVRRGITFEVQGGAFPEGVTGIKEVDTWIALWNPDRKRQASGVLNVDDMPYRQNTGGSPIAPSHTYDGGAP